LTPVWATYETLSKKKKERESLFLWDCYKLNIEFPCTNLMFTSRNTKYKFVQFLIYIIEEGSVLSTFIMEGGRESWKGRN
jgi:hypothetical protein